MYFRNHGLQRTWLDKCLKSPISENQSRGNTVNGPRRCLNLNGSIFTKFINHCEGN